jgi:hypothetical protein
MGRQGSPWFRPMTTFPRALPPFLIVGLLAVGACLQPMDIPPDTDATSTGEPDPTTGADPTTEVDPTTSTSTTEVVTTGDPMPVCGDGVIDGDELCDDGPDNAPTAACTPDCQMNKCGDGYPLADGEQCDDGPANADDAACTSECKQAVCGDGKVLVDVEVCDDGKNDGSYGSCGADCSTRAAFCGDGILDMDHEECDTEGPACLESCELARSCLKIHEANPMLTSGERTIFPTTIDVPLQVYCDMETDGGGYTFLKVDVDSELNDLPFPAKKAEALCASYGMHLFIPRSEAHLASAYAISIAENVMPIGGGGKTATSEFLQILGIYPVEPGESCPGEALTQSECSQWAAADGQSWYVSSISKSLTEPDPADACDLCSMVYTWNLDGTVKSYKTLPTPGGSSLRFMCDVGDKLPP